MPKTPLVGRRFPPFKVLADSGKRNNCGETIWKVQCECGKFRLLRTTYLKKRSVVECHCAKLDHNENFK